MTKLSDTLRSMGGDKLTKAADALDACELALKADAGAYEVLRVLGVTTREAPGMESCDQRRKRALKLLEDDHA